MGFLEFLDLFGLREFELPERVAIRHLFDRIVYEVPCPQEEAGVRKQTRQRYHEREFTALVNAYKTRAIGEGFVSDRTLGETKVLKRGTSASAADIRINDQFKYGNA